MLFLISKDSYYKRSKTLLVVAVNNCINIQSNVQLLNKSLSVTIQMKATDQYFPVVLFIMLYKAVLTFDSVNEILMSGHSNESY